MPPTCAAALAPSVLMNSTMTALSARRRVINNFMFVSPACNFVCSVIELLLKHLMPARRRCKQPASSRGHRVFGLTGGRETLERERDAGLFTYAARAPKRVERAAQG